MVLFVYQNLGCKVTIDVQLESTPCGNSLPRASTGSSWLGSMLGYFWKSSGGTKHAPQPIGPCAGV